MAHLKNIDENITDNLDLKENNYDSETQKVGKILKQAREAKKLNIPDIAKKLNIKEEYLIAIESSDFTSLPGKVYSLGFIRSYSAFLDLNNNEILGQYKKEAANIKFPEKLRMPNPENIGILPNSILLIISAGLIMVLLLLWFLFSKEAPKEHEFNAVIEEVEVKEESTESKTFDNNFTENTENATENAKESSLPIGVESETENIILENNTANPENNLPVIEEPSTPAPIIIEEENSLNPAETSSATKNNNNNDKINPVMGSFPLSKDNEKTKSAKKNLLIIKASKESWNEVIDTDGNVIFSGTLKEGESITLNNPEGFQLDTGNAGGISITINGKDLGTVGKQGAIKKGIDLTPELLIEYLKQSRQNF